MNEVYICMYKTKSVEWGAQSEADREKIINKKI